MDSDEGDQDQPLVEWVEMLNHPLFEKTIGAEILRELAEANAKAMSLEIDETKRLPYIGAVNVLSRLNGWREHFQRAYDEWKAEQAEDQKEPEDVGPELKEQWYEHG